MHIAQLFLFLSLSRLKMQGFPILPSGCQSAGLQLGWESPGLVCLVTFVMVVYFCPLLQMCLIVGIGAVLIDTYRKIVLVKIESRLSGLSSIL